MKCAIDIANEAISQDEDPYTAIAEYYDVSRAEAKELFKEAVRSLIDTELN